MHWARGAETFAHRPFSETEGAVSVALLFIYLCLFVCSYSCYSHQSPCVCACLCFMRATLCKHGDSRWSCDRHDSLQDGSCNNC